MQPKMRKFCLLFCSVLLCAGLSGCRPTSATHDLPVSGHKGVELRIACPNEATAELFRSHGQSWAMRQGVKIAIDLYENTNDPARPSQPATSADIWIIAPGRSARTGPTQASSRRCPTPTRRPIIGLSWSELLPMFREHLVQWEGKSYGLPIVGESPLCFYRAGLAPRLRPSVGSPQVVRSGSRWTRKLGAIRRAGRVFPRAWNCRPARSEPAPAAAPMPTSIVCSSPLPPASPAAPSVTMKSATPFYPTMCSPSITISTPASRASPNPVSSTPCSCCSACRSVGPPSRWTIRTEAFRDGKAVLCLADLRRGSRHFPEDGPAAR